MADFQPETLLALDIETVPDKRLMPHDWPADKFPKIAWHRIVAISFVEAEILREGSRESFIIRECRSGGEETYDEEALLKSFWSFFSKRLPRVVTWNGRAFDMPVLRFRAMMYGIATDAWSRSGDRWQGYHHRYSPSWHADVMEQISDYGASMRMGLEDVAHALGFPGKIGGSGGGVAAMVAAGRLDAVRAYCEADTLLTFGVYLHWAHATGLSGPSDHAAALEALATFLREHRVTRPHFGEFLDGWTSAPTARRSTVATLPTEAGKPVIMHPRPLPRMPPRPSANGTSSCHPIIARSTALAPPAWRASRG